MSKQSDAKAAQGYHDNPKKRQCSICRHYRSMIIEHPASGPFLEAWTEEKNRRCNLGGFSVKKTAVCNLFECQDEPSS